LTIEPVLVSCIMPTANRRRFVPLAIAYFLRQEYAERELVIADDGSDPVEDLIPVDPRIRYLRIAAGMSLGAKRNFACEQSRGAVIAHWDDDDWQSPRRLTVQMEAMRDENVDVCGIDHLLFYQPETARGWEYTYPAGQRCWLSGSTLVYRRRFWETHRFASVNAGEDAKFVWSGEPRVMRALGDHTFHVGMVHERNTSRKRTNGRWWREVPADTITALLGPDVEAYAKRVTASAARPTPASTAKPAARESVASVGERTTELAVIRARESWSVEAPIRNVFACLVHERPDCVLDLVRNLRHMDPTSTVLLYNGATDPSLFSDRAHLEQLGAVVHPAPRAAKWGTLHGFALDCMRFAHTLGPFDTMTIVDSDQLALRAGYSTVMSRHLHGQSGLGMLVNSPGVQPPTTRVAPAVTAWREVERWRPWLRRFPDGEAKWVHWSFWPSTVFTSDACRALLDLFDRDDELRAILAASQLWATEEILFPTLTALLGFRIDANPCSPEFVRYRVGYSSSQLATALRRADVYWMHPVPRRYNDTLRHQVRERFDHYQPPRPAMTPAIAESSVFLPMSVIAEMKAIEGWLEEDEADLLIGAVHASCRNGQPLGAIVEIGSYCGRSTVVLARAARAFGADQPVVAIDPHLGQVGAADQRVSQVAPSREKFLRNIAAAEVTDMVELVEQYSTQVEWNRPIGLLFIDGLHDYVNVSRDFAHFSPWLASRGYVAFHDYADYYPGVRAFVDELLAGGDYEMVRLVRSMMLVRRTH
jgi:hypothetical protein